MSVITDAVLICELGDEQAVEELNTILAQKDTARRQRFEPLDSENAAGGTKFPSLRVYQACFNHIPDTHIVEAFKTAGWVYSRNTLLYIDSELSGRSMFNCDGVVFSEEGYNW